jgi:deoxyribonuclease-4
MHWGRSILPGGSGHRPARSFGPLHICPGDPLAEAEAEAADCVSEVPLYIENTAGGDKAVARRFDDLARLWEAIAGMDSGIDLGFCFHTCHAHAAGEDLDDAVDRVRAACGRIDLLHANDSRDPPGTGADRHANLGRGEIGAEALRAMISSCGDPVVVETPGGAADLRADIEFVRGALVRA